MDCKKRYHGPNRFCFELKSLKLVFGLITNIQGGPIKTVHFLDTIFLQPLQI